MLDADPLRRARARVGGGEPRPPGTPAPGTAAPKASISWYATLLVGQIGLCL